MTGLVPVSQSGASAQRGDWMPGTSPGMTKTEPFRGP
jgi:hypothetical protein